MKLNTSKLSDSLGQLQQFEASIEALNVERARIESLGSVARETCIEFSRVLAGLSLAAKAGRVMHGRTLAAINEAQESERLALAQMEITRGLIDEALTRKLTATVAEELREGFSPQATTPFKEERAARAAVSVSSPYVYEGSSYAQLLDAGRVALGNAAKINTEVERMGTVAKRLGVKL